MGNLNKPSVALCLIIWSSVLLAYEENYKIFPFYVNGSLIIIILYFIYVLLKPVFSKKQQ